jgi:hypothetical protein
VLFDSPVVFAIRQRRRPWNIDLSLRDPTSHLLGTAHGRLASGIEIKDPGDEPLLRLVREARDEATVFDAAGVELGRFTPGDGRGSWKVQAGTELARIESEGRRFAVTAPDGAPVATLTRVGLPELSQALPLEDFKHYGGGWRLEVQAAREARLRQLLIAMIPLVI